MRKQHIFSVLICLLNLLFINSSLGNDASSTQRRNLNFKILESEFAVGKYIEADIDSLHFVPYNWTKTPKTYPDSNRMLTLKASFYVSDSGGFTNLYLAATPINYTCNIYLNGQLLVTRGNLEYGSSSRIGHSSAIFLLPSILKINAINEIAIQLYPRHGENDPINKVFIASYEEVSNYVFKRNMFGIFAYQAITVCSFIIFIYYFLLFFFQRDYHKKHYMYFAFVNLFFVLMSINSLLDYDFANSYLHERIVRSSIAFWVFWMLSFLLYYTEFFKNVRIIIRVSGIIYFTSGMYVFIQPNTKAVIDTFNTFPAFFVFIGIVFMLVVSILNLVKEKNVKAVVIFMVCLTSIVVGGYDMYNFTILEVVPYAWLVPYGIFFSNVSLFLLLAIEQARLQRQLIIKADGLKFANENLDAIVKERTMQLKTANATKDKFFSIIAHDLRNPFNALIGFSGVCLNHLKKQEYSDLKEPLTMIQEASKNGYALLENLLEWSRSQTNSIEFNPEILHLKTISNEAIASIISQSNAKRVTIVNDIVEEHCVKADKYIILTIFRNLLSNAIKYSYSDSTVTLKSFELDVHIEIHVIDNGIGIMKDDLQKLFKIEQKVSSQGTNDEIGTGLGLILCKEFIAKNYGDIWVESSFGKGSTFKFSLPKCVS